MTRLHAIRCLGTQDRRRNTKFFKIINYSIQQKKASIYKEAGKASTSLSPSNNILFVSIISKKK